MGVSLVVLTKGLNTSRFQLASNNFDIVNVTPGPNVQVNSTIGADTPKGVLAGAIATIDSGAAWQAAIATSVQFNTPITGRGNRVARIDQVLGLFFGQSEGAPFENSPAAASGVVPISNGPGSLYEVYVFETHTTANVSQLATYALGGALYVSAYGFLTVELPTTADGTTGMTGATAADVIIATITKVPTAADLTLGVRLAV
jgi:hypothetical protein